MTDHKEDKFFLELQRSYLHKDDFSMEKFNRSLPFQDTMFDRWERAKRLGFSDGVSIYNSSLVYGKVNVEKNTWIGPYTILDGSGGEINVGQFCSISAGVHIYTHDTVMWALSAGKKSRKTGSVTIGNSTYIGSKAIITLGVTVGSQCVIGAGSFVNKSFSDKSIIIGTPAKKVGSVQFDNNNEINLEFDK